MLSQSITHNSALSTSFLLPGVLLLAIFFQAGSSLNAADRRTVPPTKEQAEEYKLDPAFYKKCTLVQDILIATSDQVSNSAHLEAAYQFDMIMKNIKPAIAERIRKRKVLCILIGHSEFTSDLPQFATNKTGKELDFYNWRQRGFLTSKNGRPTVVFAEEDVLEYDGGMQLESILVHEFGHVIHGAGFDKALQERLTATFQRARAKNLWMDGRAAQRFRRVKSEKPISLLDALTKAFPDQPSELIKKCLDGGDILVNGKRTNSRVKVTAKDKVVIVFGGAKECYAHKNRAEYWAEGVQCWYDTNRTMDHDHNHIHTREQLKAYDPHLAKLCEDVLGNSPWRFVSPLQRAGKAHLKKFDPSRSPKVVDPKHIEIAALDYYDKYWKDYWKRLRDKHKLSRQLKSEGTDSLAKAARKEGSAVRGAILFAKQVTNCAKCHASGGQKLLGPDLTKMDKRITDVYLVESILDPSREIKKGFESVTLSTNAGETFTGRVIKQSATKWVLRVADQNERFVEFAKNDIDEIVTNNKSMMPDELVDQLSNRQQFLDLVKYMMELVGTEPDLAKNPYDHSLGGGTISEHLQGLVLIDENRCTACHDDKTSVRSFPANQAPDLTWGSGRINPKYIERFIANPGSVKPGTTMPNMMAGLKEDVRDEAATAMTHFLVSLGTKTFTPQPIDQAAAKRGRERFHSVGCVACHSPRNEDGTERGLESSVPLGKLEEKYNVNGLVALLKDPHAARPSGRMPNMRLSHWEALDIAHYLLQNTKIKKKPVGPFEIDRTLAKKGRLHFKQLGCVQCHKLEGMQSNANFLPLERVRIDRGCLSEKAGRWPRYSFDKSDRKDIRAALSRKSKTLTDQEQIAITLTTFNCLACHQRDNLGGVSPQRDEYFQTTDENLGEQGRIPPRLTDVGAKLNPKWMRAVLLSGRSIRPFMKTRMPQYGADNVAHLVKLFQKCDAIAEVKFATFRDQKKMKTAGHEMVGRGGLNCVACHSYRQKRAETMPSVDLTEMAQRLQKPWFYQYMRDPQRFSHNTVMPSFWPGGHAMRKDILDGNTNQQVEALWQYLKDGRQARQPRGVTRERIELVAGKEAVMLRRSYGGIGKRGIGVGYPNQVNLAFDAEQMRLAMIWKGKFADPGGVWGGQGSGSVRPLGNHLIRFAIGPELDDSNNPWVADQGRPPLHKFKGYYLDSLQRPTFMYRFDNVDVEDYPIDIKDKKSGVVIFRRTLTFSSTAERENVVFRAASHQGIVSEENGTFRVGKTLRIRVDQRHLGKIKKVPQGKQLLIPIDVTGGKSQLVLEYIW